MDAIASDDLSGFNYGSLNWHDPINNESLYANFYSGSAISIIDNQYYFENVRIDIDEYTQPSNLQLQSIWLTDSADNGYNLSRNDLFDLGFDLDLFDIEVTNNKTFDTTAPVLESLELSNNTIVSQGDGVLFLDAIASDDLSGFNYGSLNWHDPINNESLYANFYSGSAISIIDNQYYFENVRIDIDEYTQPSNLQLQSIWLTDSADNGYNLSKK